MLSAPVLAAAEQAPVQGKGLQHLLTDQNGVTHLFESQSAGFLLLMFAGLGLLLALTPCVLPMRLSKDEMSLLFLGLSIIPWREAVTI